MTTRDAALAAEKAGISVLPPRQDGTKRPLLPTWSHLQRKRATPQEIEQWYKRGLTGAGWVCGRISGGLEVIDFDDRGAFAEYKRLIADANLSELFESVCNGYLEHSPNGAHLVYRCDEIDGNAKLAKVGGKTLIETRGEGGFIIVAPTHGSVNKSGSYELVSGGVDSIATITPGQRNNLHDVARMLDESIQPTEHKRHGPLADDRPGDDYNARASWDEVLEPHGWSRVSSRTGVTSWRRPGKDHGISATTNHGDSDLLYVFSTNTEFESERGYSKFSAYGLLNHGGDFAEASRTLSMLGFGSRVEVPEEEVDLSLILSPGTRRELPTMQELCRVPGLVGEMAEWITESAIKPQPILALASSLSAVATLIGGKVCTQTGLRSNVYVLGVGETGCGKERARQAIGSLFSELGCGRMLGDSFASDSAVETAIGANPISLYMIDEIGQFLGLMKGDQAPAYLRGIISVFLRMYSASEGVYRKRTYSDSERNTDCEIVSPCLSIYGTTVPGNLYGSLKRENLSDGLLSRFLVFESDDPDPHVKMPSRESRRVSERILDGARHWIDYQPPGGNLETEPLEVRATPNAWDVFADLELRMRSRRSEVRRDGGDQGPYTRLWATAQKLALIRACGVSPEPEITESDAQWACDVVQVCTERFLARVGDNLAENRTEANVQRLLEVIGRGGDGGMSKSAITRSTQSFTRRERDDGLATLVESGQVSAFEVTGKQRPITHFKRNSFQNSFQ